MTGTKEQGDKPITEEDVVTIKPYENSFCVALSFASCKCDKKEARELYNEYTSAFCSENVALSEPIAAKFTRLTGLSAPRILEIVRQKQDELNAQPAAQG